MNDYHNINIVVETVRLMFRCLEVRVCMSVCVCVNYKNIKTYEIKCKRLLRNVTQN